MPVILVEFNPSAACSQRESDRQRQVRGRMATSRSPPRGSLPTDSIGGRPYLFFRFGRCVRAEPAAVFAALLLLGFRRTLDAAEAARLLVTSLFAVRFAIRIFLTLGTRILLCKIIRKESVVQLAIRLYQAQQRAEYSRTRKANLYRTEPKAVGLI